MHSSLTATDRVFVHALNTLKKIPATGAPRPPAADRLHLYGFYKQAIEGDIADVMARPTAATSPSSPEDLQREQDKWDAWHSQHGVGRTEAKRRYIEALIETMHRYATTPDARELAAELEFVWGQIKNNSPSSETGQRDHDNDGDGDGDGRTLGRRVVATTADGMRVLSPMSERDEAELEEEEQRIAHEEVTDGDGEDDGGIGSTGTTSQREQQPGQSQLHSQHQRGRLRRGTMSSSAETSSCSRSVERALVQLSAEVAALREQISSPADSGGDGSRCEWGRRKPSTAAMMTMGQRGARRWVGWALWAVARHAATDLALLGLVLLWLRRRGDGRLEELVRGAVRLGREYVGGMVRVRMRAIGWR